MRKIDKKHFLKLFDQKTVKYIGVRIEKEGYKDPEVIIIPNNNFDKEKEFYNKTYDENLENKFSQIKIQITDAGVFNDLASLWMLGLK